MKKILFILTFLLLTTGCWNYKELNNCAIVTGLSIDYADDKYEVALLFSNAKKEDTETDAQVTIASAKGYTIHEAIKNINLSTPKEIYISHLSVVIISEEIARNGVTPIIDFLLRDPESNQNFYLVVAKDEDPKNILSVITPLSDYPSQNITSTIDVSEKEQGRITNSDFNRFVSTILKKGKSPVANSIVLIQNTDEDTDENSKRKKYTKLDTIGIFKKDKLVDWTNTEESIGINMLINDVGTLYIDVPWDNNNIVVSTTSYKLKNNINKNNIIVNINAQGMLNEVGSNIDLTNQKIIDEIEYKVEEKMKSYTTKAINKAKSLKTDIFGYGNMLYKKEPKYFNSIEDWNELFPNINIEVNVNFKITNFGVLDQSIGELSQ